MQYGICHLSLVPVRSSPDEASEMTTQLLYGEHFKVLENRKYHSRIRLAFDKSEGWVGNDQITLLEEQQYKEIDSSKVNTYAKDLVSFVETDKRNLVPILLGSSVGFTTILAHRFEGNTIVKKQKKTELTSTALYYLDAPYLWGGKTPFGIDSSGFAQMVYKINGYPLLRSAQEQATQGDALSFIEESEPGDLAFFDNQDGEIDHVGIIMENNYIIHAHGKVRVDRLDHTGIFNVELRSYTHTLRVIKKII